MHQAKCLSARTGAFSGEIVQNRTYEYMKYTKTLMTFIDVLFSEHNHLTSFFHLGLGQFGRFVYKWEQISFNPNTTRLYPS